MTAPHQKASVQYQERFYYHVLPYKEITMHLSDKQVGVLKGIVTALFLSISIIVLGLYADPFGYHAIAEFPERLNILGISLVLPTSLLIASIGRLAKFRFFNPDDIDGSGLTQGSHEAHILQSLLQNTLEQFVIAFGVYTAWCLMMPTAWLSTAPLCSVAFAVGRVCFIKRYNHGAPARAFGFALTFYPTVMLFVVLIIYKTTETLS